MFSHLVLMFIFLKKINDMVVIMLSHVFLVFTMSDVIIKYSHVVLVCTMGDVVIIMYSYVVLMYSDMVNIMPAIVTFQGLSW